MLLGKIQGGKTTTYIGIIALAFDNNYDVAIVLTKGTKALAEQTLKRFNVEFEHFIKREDNLEIYDIMFLPPRLTRYQLNKKLIFIVKKEDDNLNRLFKTFFEDYPDLSKRQILIIDDEADYASVGFKKSTEEGLKINVISKQISDFRTKLSSFLQVTATPYSLYLQPPDYNTESILFKPLKPSFTELVPIHDKYVGSETYFGESSEDDADIAYYLFIEVPEKELEVLGKQDLRYISNILSTPNLKVFRDAILNFVVGGCIRRLQNKHLSETLKKFSFVVHTETGKPKHEWQYNLIEALISKLEDSLVKDNSTLKSLIKYSYENLLYSLKIIHEYIPSFEEVFNEVQIAIKNEYIGLYKVNSDSEIKTLLDESGQLKLSNPLNIFIGGQILDRGVTIENLIGFFLR